jgi:hypothetical protein
MKKIYGLYHRAREIFSRRIWGNHQLMITLPTHHSDEHHSTSENPNEYQKPKDGSSRIWNGCNPSLHTPARVLPLSEYSCDFCNDKDQGMTMQGSNTHGVLFVCPECQDGLTTRLKEIFGETLWELIKANKQIMVQRTSGLNELWYVSSKLPVIHRGTWHLRVQSHRNLLNSECLEKAVPVEKLKQLNETISA